MVILGEEAGVVTRTAPGTFVDGEAVLGTTEEIDILISFQPLSGKELERLPEGQREKVTHRGYTETELRTTPPDVLTIDGADYQVFEVRQERAVIPHYRVLFVKVQES